jgi:hypothetical protein
VSQPRSLRRLRALIPALLLLAALPSGAVSIPVIASANVELLANIPDAGSIGGRFARINGRTYFFRTGVGGLNVYDATDPALPLLVGSAGLPHWQNEDVDLSPNRKILLVTLDRESNGTGVLFVFDIADPRVPILRSVYPYPSAPGEIFTGGGHTATCVLDCSYAWVSGTYAGWMLSVDLTDPSAPKLGGWFRPRAGSPNKAFARGTVHDANVDQTDPTKVWVVGSGGTDVYSVTSAAQAKNPGAPFGSFATPAGSAYNTFVHHNSLRPKSNLLLVAEENWLHETNSCADQGRFQTYGVSSNTITPIGQWKTEATGANYTNGRSPVQATCSAHWFDYRSDGLVAIAWYNQGVRFLNTANPAGVYQRGFFLPPGATAFSAYFHPVRRDIIYTLDAARGLDVLRFTESAAGPVVNAPTARTSPDFDRSVRFEPSPTWRTACLIVRPAS